MSCSAFALMADATAKVSALALAPNSFSWSKKPGLAGAAPSAAVALAPAAPAAAAAAAAGAAGSGAGKGLPAARAVRMASKRS
jgi:hypothetical protein